MNELRAFIHSKEGNKRNNLVKWYYWVQYAISEFLAIHTKKFLSLVVVVFGLGAVHLQVHSYKNYQLVQIKWEFISYS